MRGDAELKSLAKANVRDGLESRFKDLIDVILYGPLSILKHIWIQIILLLFMFGFGTLVFMNYQHLNPLTAFLGSVSTITTIGIYAPPIVGMSPSEQVLLIITFIVSVGLAASIVQSTITTAMRRDILREQLIRKRIGRLEGHVITIGYGYLGKYISEWLSHMKVRQVIITRNRSTAKEAVSKHLLAIEAPTTRAFEALKEARVDRASTLICALDDDGDNLLVAMSARKLNKDIRILTVVHDREIVESAAASDIDVAIPIFDLAASLLASSAIASEVAGIFLPRALAGSEPKKQPYILEFSVREGYGVGMRLDDLEKVAPILMLSRRGRVIPNPPDDFELEEGDSMLVLGSMMASIEQFRRALSSNP